MRRPARRGGTRLARVPLVVLASLAASWLALTFVVAREHGERRRATFDGPAQVAR
jgi:hypothetical protein